MSNLDLLLVLIPFIAFIIGVFLLIFIKGKRKTGAFTAAVSAFWFFVFAVIVGNNSTLKEGWENAADKRAAAEIGITDPLEYAPIKAESLAKQQAETARKEAEAKAERDRIAAEEQAVEDAKRKAEAEAEEANRIAGFHCLEVLDGSHIRFSRTVESMLRDPDSFQLMTTKVTPVGPDGRHKIFMEYRARNGFGGMNVATAVGTFANDECTDVEVLSLE